MAIDDTGNNSAAGATELVFLGTSGCIQVPAFFCNCETCSTARNDPSLCRTRAGLAVLGTETVLVDASPDLAAQLEREHIGQVGRIFLTHWHFDHFAGLSELGEPASIGNWPKVHVYVPTQVAHHFSEEWAYLRSRLEVHSIGPGDVIELPDGLWSVVKTNHTEHSVGFVVRAAQTWAYLVDGVVPPPETVERLGNCVLLIIEATMDELDETHWKNFSVEQAAAFWKQTNIRQCLLTHCSRHSWRQKRLIAGWTEEYRQNFEQEHSGLRFAFDGMRIRI